MGLLRWNKTVRRYIHIALLAAFIAGTSYPVFAASGKGIPFLRSAFETLFQLFSSRTASMGIAGLLTALLSYLILRRILEHCGPVYHLYAHKISAAVSILLGIFISFMYWSSREIEGYLRARLIGWHGIALTILGIILITWASYRAFHRWRALSTPPPL